MMLEMMILQESFMDLQAQVHQLYERVRTKRKRETEIEREGKKKRDETQRKRERERETMIPGTNASRGSLRSPPSALP